MRKGLLTVFFACLPPLIAFLVYSPSVPGKLAPVVGLNQVDWVGFDGHGHNQLYLADTAGIHWVRYGVYWYHVQPDSANQPYDWSGYDSIFGALRTRLDENEDTAAFEIVPVFIGTPGWAADSSCWDPDGNGEWDDGHPQDRFCHPAADHMDKWRDFIATFADRYTYIDYLEVWNEALGEDWNGGDPDRLFFQGDPAKLAEMTDSFAVAVNSEDKVLAWGNAGSPSSGSGWTTAKLLDMTASGSVDIVSNHCYSSGSGCVDYANGLRDMLDSAGYSDLNQWFTEGWYPSSPEWAPDSISPIHPTDVENATWVLALRNLARDSAWFEKFFFFRWAQTEPYYHHHDTMPDNLDWHRHHWNYRVVGIDPDTWALEGVRMETYCHLVQSAGNLGSQDRCLNSVSVSGPTSPKNNETCSYTATPSGGSGSYSYDWAEDGVNKPGSEETHTMSYADTTIELTVRVNDQAGGVAVFDTLNVTFSSSGMMCFN